MNTSGNSKGKDWWVQAIGDHFEPRSRFLIPVLQFIQSQAGYLAPEAMKAAAKYLKVPESKVYGVASFYAQFHFQPRGKHTITVCRGTACHVRGSGRLVEELEKHLEIKASETTSDLMFSLETVACVGACALAPLVVIDKRAHGRQTSLSLKKTIDNIKGSSAGKNPTPQDSVTKPVDSKKTARPKASKKKAKNQKAKK